MSSLCNRSKHAGMDWCDDAVVKMDTSKILATFVKVPYRLHKMYVRLKSTLWRLYGTPGKTKRALFLQPHRDPGCCTMSITIPLLNVDLLI